MDFPLIPYKPFYGYFSGVRGVVYLTAQSRSLGLFQCKTVFPVKGLSQSHDSLILIPESCVIRSLWIIPILAGRTTGTIVY